MKKVCENLSYDTVTRPASLFVWSSLSVRWALWYSFQNSWSSSFMGKDIIIARKYLSIQIGIVKNVDASEHIEFLSQKSAYYFTLEHRLRAISHKYDNNRMGAQSFEPEHWTVSFAPCHICANRCYSRLTFLCLFA